MLKRLMIRLGAFALLVALTASASALVFAKPLPEQSVVGGLQYVQVRPLDDFYAIARRYDVGFYELVESNPGVNPDAPKVNTVLIVPTRYVLPNVPHKGIVINIAEMRLYYFPKHQNQVYSFPVGVGQVNWDTPLGLLKIVEKIKHPNWYVPKSIYEYRKKRGDPVPRVVKAGPDNPLGDFAMRLSNPSYLIHGTNEPDGVGQRSSAGCIRLYPEDIKQLFAMVPRGTPVNIINQPYKIGRMANQVLIEAHEPFKENKKRYTTDANFVSSMLKTYAVGLDIDWNMALAKQTTKDQTGLPVAVGRVSALEVR